MNFTHFKLLCGSPSDAVCGVVECQYTCYHIYKSEYIYTIPRPSIDESSPLPSCTQDVTMNASSDSGMDFCFSLSFIVISE